MIKPLKHVAAALLALCCGAQAQATDYNINYDAAQNVYSATWEPHGMENPADGVEVSAMSPYYMPEKGNGWFVVRIYGGSDAAWMKPLARRIAASDNMLRNQSIKITFANGERITTSEGMLVIDRIVAGLLRSNSADDIYISLMVYPHLSQTSSATGGNSIERAFSLLRSSDITSITVDGHLLRFGANTGTAKHIDGMLSQIAAKAGTSSGLGKRQAATTTSPSGSSRVKPSASTATSVTFNNIDAEHNVYKNGRKGMNIKLSFVVNGLKGVDCKLIGYFYFQSGKPLRDFNGEYHTTGGDVSVSETICPGYDSTRYTDFTIFMPYGELHLSDGVTHRVMVNFMLEDLSTDTFVGNTESPYYRFKIS